MFFPLNSIKKPRKEFNLLHLETGEHFFLSLKVSLILMNQEIRGKLHLCSRSMVFEPKELKQPLMKMKYSNSLLMKILKNFTQQALIQVLTIKWDYALLQEDIDQLDLNQVLNHQKKDEMNNELLERLYGQGKAKKFLLNQTNGILIRVDKLFIINRNPISPYITETCQDNILYTISKSNSKQNVIRFLKLYQGLNQCSDETIYLNTIIQATLNEGINEYKSIAQNNGTKIEFILKVRQITPQGQHYGLFVATKESIIQFIPLVNSPKPRIKTLTLTDIKYFLKYRYMFQNTGIEIWVHNKKRSMLFVFEEQSHQEQIYRYLSKKATKNCLSSISLPNATQQWQDGCMSNYDYLMLLNTLANRSFNDLSAYPVFPWIIDEYNQEEFAIDNPQFYRDLSKPIGALNKHRLQKYKAFYQQQLKDKNQETAPYLYPTHYSSPGTVVYYLIRKIPEFVIKLQNGVFGPTDRIFRGVDSTWYTTMNLHADSKEMIPEFYSMDSDFLVNCDKLELGVTQEGEIIDDAVIPKWADSIQDFQMKMRMALESEYVSANINKWIDLIFGYKSEGEEAIACDNIFYPYTYAQNVQWDKCKTAIEKQAMEVQVAEFGQVPIQLFNSAHPVKIIKISGQLKQIEEEKKQLKNQLIKQQQGETKQLASLKWENEKLKFNLDTIKQEMAAAQGQVQTFNSQFDQDDLDKNGFDFLNDESLA